MSTVGISEEVIQKYIEMKGKEDSEQAQLELKKYYGREPIVFYSRNFK